ncbi:MAG: alpha-L-fucosidase [Puniceicoccales bacterium]|jgi:alpha-L-fucosidase|nr:alpha-L-fucosidase [Puniceicoccales bacterium]
MMKTILTLLVCLTAFTAVTANAQRKEEDDNRIGANLNHPEREAWLRNLGFGLFIHWAHDSQLGIVISHSLAGASDDYSRRYFNDLPKTFNPRKFDPAEWARLAKVMGVKYVVFTTKHHAGFCMWDTKTTDFNIMNTPYKKDILRELVDALRAEGLAIGFYYSPEDFKFLYDNGISVNRGNLRLSKEFMRKYEDFITKQCDELFTQYGPIDILFIDGEPKDPAKYTGWKHQPKLIVTRGAINTPEQYVPGSGANALWESNITMGTQWQYKPTNDTLKTGTKLIELLIEIRAKGGNFLLNIGPHPDGYIPSEQEERMREIAAWMFINQESIYNVRPWVITNEGKLWFSRSVDEKTVYVYITGEPSWKRGDRKQFLLKSVHATNDTRISILGQNDKVVEYSNVVPKSKFKQTPNGLEVSVVRAQRIYNDYKWPNPIVIKLENVKPALVPPKIITGTAKVSGNTIRLSARLDNLGRADEVKVGFLYRPYAGFAENTTVGEWKQTDLISRSQKGKYEVELSKLGEGEYEYRAVVIQKNVSTNGDTRRFTVN